MKTSIRVTIVTVALASFAIAMVGAIYYLAIIDALFERTFGHGYLIYIVIAAIVTFGAGAALGTWWIVTGRRRDQDGLELDAYFEAIGFD